MEKYECFGNVWVLVDGYKNGYAEKGHNKSSGSGSVSGKSFGMLL